MGCGSSNQNFTEPKPIIDPIQNSPPQIEKNPIHQPSPSSNITENEKIENNPIIAKGIFYKTFQQKIEPKAKKGIKWKRGELIGRGAYGKVYQGLDLNTGKIIAIKTVIVFFLE